MRTNVFIPLIASVLSSPSYGQAAKGFDYVPYFSAVVVSNVDSSAKWYQAVFAMTVKNKMEDTNHDYRIFILESSQFVLELLELKGSLTRKNLLEGKPAGTQIQGHFKIGFKVAEMDDCLKRLASLKINVPQVWTDTATKKRNFLITDPDGNLIQFFE